MNVAVLRQTVNNQVTVNGAIKMVDRVHSIGPRLMRNLQR